MHLRKLILDNFKSHTHSSISFEAGTNAICGKNKAGKTTIVQAVGLALFDFCPGRRGDFIRDGANSATIQVELVSALDERVYEISRRIGNSAHWLVRDPKLGDIVVNGNSDVTDWLRDHLGVGREADLPALFEDAVGVPQGELTSAFVQTPARRQSRFNALLRIEEYRTAYDNLREAERYLENDINDVQQRIKRLEGETDTLPAIENKVAELQSEIGLLERKQNLLARKAARLSRIDNVHVASARRLARLNIIIARLEVWEAKRISRMKDAQSRRSQAATASNIMTECHSRYKSYEIALNELEHLLPQTAERDTLMKEKATLEQKRAVAEAQEMVHQEKLDAIVLAEMEMTCLIPLMAAQTSIEASITAEQTTLSDATAELKSTRLGHSASSDGKCPFLRDACRNIAATGQTLHQFFDDQLIVLEDRVRKSDTGLLEWRRRLNALGKMPNDPKTLYAIAFKEASKRSEIETSVNGAKVYAGTCAQHIAQLDTRLVQYATLNSSIERLNQIIAENTAPYNLYRANSPIALDLGACLETEKLATQALDRLSSVLTARRTQQQQTRQSYDSKLHARIQNALQSTMRQRSEKSGRLDVLRPQWTELTDALVALQAKCEELKVLCQEKAHHEAVKGHLNFIRRTIRDAGPLVTSLLVARISRDAQELFRALIGDETLGLRWTADYEIIMLEHGRERTLDPAAGSEKGAAALAVRLALLQNMGDIRFAFFDEPTVHFDEERRGRLVEGLLGLRCFTQLFVISHDDAFERNTNHVVRVEKPGDYSIVTTS
jgi:exonuclease SbcC